jgi:hypothetical protein
MDILIKILLLYIIQTFLSLINHQNILVVIKLLLFVFDYVLEEILAHSQTQIILKLQEKEKAKAKILSLMELT